MNTNSNPEEEIQKNYGYVFLFSIFAVIFFIMSLFLFTQLSLSGILTLFASAFCVALASSYKCSAEEKEKEVSRAKLDKEIESLLAKNNVPQSLIPTTESQFNLFFTERINSYNKCASRPSSFVVIDTETTGFDPTVEHLIQIACIRYIDGNIQDTFCEYINPPAPIPAHIEKLTGITNAQLMSRDTIDKVLPRLVKFVKDDILVCHNASFDMSFLQTKLNACNMDLLNNEVVDTLSLSRKAIKDVVNHKLETLKHYLNIETASHNALSDCETTLALYLYCKDKVPCKAPVKKEDVILSTINEEYLNVVKTILQENQRDIKFLDPDQGKIYFYIHYENHSFLKLKTTGKLRYWLTNFKENEILELNNNAHITQSSKNESGLRVFLNEPMELIKYTPLILNLYDKAVELKKLFDEYDDEIVVSVSL